MTQETTTTWRPSGTPHGTRHARFRSGWGTELPRIDADPLDIACPNCGGGAHADRRGATIYGWHDGIGQCGWVDTLTVGRDQHGAVTLT